MATIKVNFKPSPTSAEGVGSIYYLIIHARKIRQLLSRYDIRANEWNESRATITIAPQSERKSYLLYVRQSIYRDIRLLSKIVRRLEDYTPDFTADDVIEEYNRYQSECSLTNYMRHIISNLKNHGKIRTSETYTATLHSFKRFLANSTQKGQLYYDNDIALDCLTSEMMEAYEAWQRQRGLSYNTISFYIRIIRAVYNRAVESGIIDDHHPFRHVYTGVDKTVKRALPLDIIRQLKSLNLSESASLDYARDMFMLSFMLRGMSFIDMAYLRKSDLINGHITYRRRKTGQQLTIEWTTEMQTILDKYPPNKSIYLLPIIKNPDIKERSAYRNAGYNINHNLKTVAKIMGISVPLTLYVARHSWASAAKAKGIPVSVISEGMGHDSEQTTQIYLASLDTSVIDQANALILSSL